MVKIRVKRVYEEARKEDGRRILVDRLWPRGLTKAKAQIDFWAKAVAPSSELRKWYGHNPKKWKEFKKRYFKELGQNKKEVTQFLKHLSPRKNTFLFSSKESQLNNAHALKDYFDSCF